MKRCLVLLLALLSLASCANIPDRTPPRVVLDATAQRPRQIGKPPPGLDPYTLVQQFVRNAGYTDVASTYLTEEAAQHWGNTVTPTIIEDEFKTIPQSVQENGSGGNRTVVVFTGTQVGTLSGDKSFSPGVQPLEYSVTLTRDQDNQWRISDPPPARLITESDFESSYRRVSLEFFDPDLRVLVPDLRYVEIEPRQNIYGQVVALLLAGPSDSLKGAVRSQLDGLALSTNVVQEPDGAILVNLAKVENKQLEDRQRIAAQLVYSLREVTTSPLRLRSQGAPLVPDKADWTVGDVGSYDALTTLKSDLLGMVVVNGKLLSLRDGNPAEGPAGDGAYDIISAAQSLDGGQLAVVARTPTGPRLRVGKANGELPEVDLARATTLTRPTWRFAGSNEAVPTEVWTVQDGNLVVRVGRTSEGKWEDYPVEASELTRNGPITQLRLSRDGARVAAVVNGSVVIASVVRANEAVTLSAPRTLQGGVVKDVVSIDWLDRLTVIVATGQSVRPVVSIPIDGLRYNPYNNTNLSPPVTAITAAPSRAVLVTDRLQMWSTQQPGKVWQRHQFGQPPGSVPFYPG
ncbi:LpqB family beta-propeller domain-containing protein [Actinokineospora auranticolor]|uniref:Sporulation and spore germination protein n=1 Tax=Actinokineospora auranticolor TaxID=155976 RepID=A0A2S6GXA0_9PSEU|nr:LpqB family beta-propeller domain-containing protein [Actinokineospora auranticolor]PPK69833.1 sporulation and spore germination protein [Actinokineospora auranticolor]